MPDPPRPADRIARRTAHLGLSSRLLYRIDHYTSLPSVAVTVGLLLVAVVCVGAGLGFPNGWLIGFEISVSAVTLAMVFTIQHTQGREQAATQRKLDELLRVAPGAKTNLMMLEEAPQEFLLEVEVDQREAREGSASGHGDGR